MNDEQSTPRKLVVSGAGGLIGRSLLEHLVGKGYHITGLTRQHRSPREDLHPSIHWVHWDSMNVTAWESVLDDVYGVINLAGHPIASTRWNQTQRARILRSRINVGQLICRVLAEKRVMPKVFIQASATGIYGSRADEELTEASQTVTDGFLPRVCHRWEASSSLCLKTSIRHCVIRTGMVLHPEGGALPRMMEPFHFYAGGPLGNGKHWMPWIHIFDAVRAIDFLLENAQLSGAFNLTSPYPVTNKNFARALGKAMNKPAFFRTPKFILKLILGDMAEELLFSSQRVLPARLLVKGFNFLYPNLDEALHELLNR